MDDEPLWRSRLRWRWRGAMLWPAFAALTVFDAWLLGWLPVAGDGGTDVFPALLLAGVLNLIAVAALAPLASVALRRRRPDLPKVVATDVTGTAMVVLVTLGFVAGGLLHRPALKDAEADYAHSVAAARDFVRREAPREFRSGALTSLKMEDELYRVCAAGPDPKRWFCLFVSTDQAPPGIQVDDNRESNASLNRFGAYR